LLIFNQTSLLTYLVSVQSKARVQQ